MSEEGYVGGLDLHPGERKDERIAALRVDIVGATDVWCFWLELLQVFIASHYIASFFQFSLLFKLTLFGLLRESSVVRTPLRDLSFLAGYVNP